MSCHSRGLCLCRRHQRSHLADQLPEETLYGLLSMRREAAGDDPYYRDYIVSLG